MVRSWRRDKAEEQPIVLEWADNNWLRVLGYLVAAGLCLAASAREDARHPATWRPFWPMTGALLFVMALGRARGIAEWLIDQFRGEAYEAGWYDARRPIQAAVVLGVGGVWLLSVLVACWRIPERRRRYLPMTIAVLTIGAFVAVRVVSLHQIDSLLYGTHVFAMRAGTAIEYILLLAACGCTFWAPTPSTPSSEGHQVETMRFMRTLTRPPLRAADGE